jgi:hypothetical protein
LIPFIYRLLLLLLQPVARCSKTGTKIQLAALFDACVCGSKIKNEKTAKKGKENMKIMAIKKCLKKDLHASVEDALRILISHFRPFRFLFRRSFLQRASFKESSFRLAKFSTSHWNRRVSTACV